MLLKTCNRNAGKLLKRESASFILKLKRYLCEYSDCTDNERVCDLLVVGGGAGGCSIAAKFARQLDKLDIIIVEPSDVHYYQPMFTLIGGGMKGVAESARPMNVVLPSKAVWVKDRVRKFDPDSNRVFTQGGAMIYYKFMVVACGVVLNYSAIGGVQEALEMKDSGVCSNYLPNYAEKTFDSLKKLRSGNAIFSYPNTPVKCAGAPLKACFISEHYTRLMKRRHGVKFFFKTSLPVIFAAKYYADSLVNLCNERHIDVKYRQELIYVKPKKKEAIFRNLDKTYELETIKYSMLHVTPPMSTPQELHDASMLVDKSGFLNVDKCTLQHVTYKNVFGIGDCTNLPTSKTAAAVSTQGKVLQRNLMRVMKHKTVDKIYNGYTSCPLVTGYGTCILAEFDYEKNPTETFPVDQRKERSMSYYLKKDILPRLYWLGMKGFWNGPDIIRKICHLGLQN